VGAIQAASILAKVARDAEMCALDETFPGYGFAQHKGYPTQAHLKALSDYGLTPHHRLSFGPCKALVT
jgi:ribonuclease HII